LLNGPGYVWRLDFGDFVLLQPERINAYAAAVIRTARAQDDETGCILEEKVLAGELKYEGMKRLPAEQDIEAVVLRAMLQTFVKNGLCLREESEKGVLLVFPTLFKHERPDPGDHPAPLVTYHFNGMIDEIYATLVVRLHHTKLFDKDRLWRYAADFKTSAGQQIGFTLHSREAGQAALTVYCPPDAPLEIKVAFESYINEHLTRKADQYERERHYVCPHCGEAPGTRAAARKRLERNLQDIVCGNCENRVTLWDLLEQKFNSEEAQRKARQMDAEAQSGIDNDSKELILSGEVFTTIGNANQIFRPTPNADWGIDGEIEFKDRQGKASGKRLYLQLKHGDSYLRHRKGDGKEIFDAKERHLEYWQQHNYDVMLVIRNSDGLTRWMNVTEYLKRQAAPARQIVFEGEKFDADSVRRYRDKLLAGC
jgi:hypothetical protein